MDTSPVPDQVVTLDICGQVCPASLLITLRKINEIKDAIHNGRTRLDVLTDNRDAVGTISEAVANMGYGLSTEKREGHYVMSISAAR
ncbi:MAG TPA: sulfurtransferase TusA family protein [Candidatus Deferrimicrobiaceae bacterium]